MALCLRDKILLRGYGIDEFLALNFKKRLPHKSGKLHCILPYYIHTTKFFIVGLAKCLQHVATALNTQQAITEWDKGSGLLK